MKLLRLLQSQHIGILIMDHENSEKNPLFLPALILTLIPVVIFVFAYSGSFKYRNDAMTDLLFFLMFTAPFAAIILSVVGLVDARKLQEPIIGCVFSLFLLFLKFYFLLWCCRPICQNPKRHIWIRYRHTATAHLRLKDLGKNRPGSSFLRVNTHY